MAANGKEGWRNGTPAFSRTDGIGDRAICLNVFGTTCAYRLIPYRMVFMGSDVNYKRLVQMIIRYSYHLEEDMRALKEALNAAKETADKLTTRDMTRSDIARITKRVKRRTQAVDAIMDKNGFGEMWRGISG